MKKIIVTGGAGFIGSNLCGALHKDENNYIICVDNFFTGRKSNVEHLVDDRFKIVEHDIVDGFNFEPVDEVYNLACPASPPHYQFDPIHTLDTNYIGMRNILEYAKKCGAKVLQTSTSEVYGDPEIHPQAESYRGNVNTYGIRACYDEGKRVAETLCFEYNHKGVDTKIVRIFNTYGPKMRADDGRVVSNFICQALKGEDITIYGDGSQTRSFCYVDDMVNGLIKMMASNEHGPINLGNPGEFTIKELCDKIINVVNTRSKVSYLALPSDDPTRRKPDITKANELLGWAPKISLDEGILPTIEYFKGEI